jgi:hypothetical protein
MLLVSVGDAKLMPSAPENQCLVITAKNGYRRNSTSWVLGRMLRDYESWMDLAVRTKLEKMLDERHRYLQRSVKAKTAVPRPGQTGLCISIYEPSKAKRANPRQHVLLYSGLVVVPMQVMIAAIPIVTCRDWSILMITSAGTALALVTGSIPQWKAEKWSCRHGSYNTYILTAGNGAQHAIVILGNSYGLDLEDLAVSSSMTRSSSGLTRLCLDAVSVSWICLLIAAAGLTQNTWFLLAVGGLGIVQNLLVAGWRRNPSALGIHLQFREVTEETATMDALFAAEERYATVGHSLSPVFFPGILFPEEVMR